MREIEKLSLCLCNDSLARFDLCLDDGWGDLDTADDLFQDTFAIVIRKIRRDGLLDPSKLAAYVHRTAHNVYIGWVRKESRRNTQPDSDAISVVPAESDLALDIILREERANAVRQLIDELSTERDRQILKLYYLQDQEKVGALSSL